MKKIDLKTFYLSVLLASSPLMGSGAMGLLQQSQEPISFKIQEHANPQDLDSSQVHLQTLFEYIRADQTNQAIDLIYRKRPPLDVPGEDGMLPLHWACRRGNLYLFRVLMTKIPEQKSIRGKGGVTPLYCAALGGNVKIIKELLKLEVDLNERTNCGSTAFHGACATGSIEAAQYLLETNPLMLFDMRNDGKTGLHAAVEKKQKLMVEFLMNKLDINFISCDEDL